MGKVLINPRSIGQPGLGAAIRVLLLHGYRLLNDAIAASLRRCPQLSLVAAAGNPAEALSALRRVAVDVAVVDVSLESDGGKALVHELHRNLPELRILAMGLESETVVVELVEAGARGYLLRDASLTELVEIIQALYHGETRCSPQVATAVFARLASLGARAAHRRSLGSLSLTSRQREILVLIASGLRNKEIAKHLDLSLSTVKNHVHKILEHLGVRRRREAIQLAYELGLLEDPLPRNGGVNTLRSARSG